MKINTTPLGILLGTTWYPRLLGPKHSKVFNVHDSSLLKDKISSWDENSNHIFNKRPLLSTDLYYAYLLGNVDELTPAGMFAEPEKSQVYLDVLQKGCIGADLTTILLTAFESAYTYQEVMDLWKEDALHLQLGARCINDVWDSLRKLNRNLYDELTKKKHTKYFLIGQPENSKAGTYGVLDTTTIVSSLGEVFIKSDIYGSSRERKPRCLFMYVDSDANINIMTDGRSTKHEVKQHIKHLIQSTPFTHGSNAYKLILVKVLFNVLEESGSLFDFPLQVSKEQQCSIVKEGLWAGLVSSIKHPQDGSITDLLSCIADKVTYGSYYKGKLVNSNFSKLRSSVGPKRNHATE